jgi:hypothetical protein
MSGAKFLVFDGTIINTNKIDNISKSGAKITIRTEQLELTKEFGTIEEAEECFNTLIGKLDRFNMKI